MDERLNLITEDKAAQILGLSVQTLRNNRCLRRGVPYCKLGRAVRYRLSDIEEYITDSRIDPNDA